MNKQKFEHFRLDVTWGCPVYESLNHDKVRTDEGALNDLWCIQCGSVFEFEEGEDSE